MKQAYQLITVGKVLSMEAVNAPDSLTNRFQAYGDVAFNFFKNTSDVLLSTFKVEEEVSLNLISLGSNLAKLRGVRYVDIKDVAVYVPSGMSCKYPELLEVLERAVRYNNDIIETTLEPLIKWLSAGLNQPQSLSAIFGSTGTYNFAFDNAKHEDLVNMLKNCFDTNSTHDQLPVKYVFERLLDIEESVKTMNDLVVEAKTTLPKTVLSKIEEAKKLLNTLVERHKQDPDKYNLSPRTVTVLTELMGQAAMRCEFYSVTRYYLMLSYTAITNTVGNLDVALNR